MHKKLLLLALISIFSSNLQAEETKVVINPTDISVKGPEGETNVLIGKNGQINVDTTNPTEGTTKVTVNNPSAVAGVAGSAVAGVAAGAAKFGQAVEQKMQAEGLAPVAKNATTVTSKNVGTLSNQSVTGSYDIAGTTTSQEAVLFAGASNITIMKDGKIYQETEDGYTFTGGVKFTSNKGEQKKIYGTFNLRESD